MVDEAYIDFASVPSLCPQLAELSQPRHPEDAVQGAMAWRARVGALMAAPEVIALTRKVIPPYAITELTVETVTPLLQPAALAATRDTLRCCCTNARGWRRHWPQLRADPQGLAQ